MFQNLIAEKWNPGILAKNHCGRTVPPTLIGALKLSWKAISLVVYASTLKNRRRLPGKLTYFMQELHDVFGPKGLTVMQAVL